MHNVASVVGIGVPSARKMRDDGRHVTRPGRVSGDLVELVRRKVIVDLPTRYY